MIVDYRDTKGRMSHPGNESRLVTRRYSLGLIGSALLLPSCARKPSSAVRIGSKSTSENMTIAEIYAVALERENIPVERHMNFGDGPSLMAALQRGDIDIYPESVQTHPYNAGTSNNGIAQLEAAPANDSPCLATSQYAAVTYWLLTLKRCAELAPQLRLAATPEFLASGALDRLRRIYGGFKFKTILTYPQNEQYVALSRGDADVGNAFTTDPRIAGWQLIVLRDDKKIWPQYSTAPLVRVAALRGHPRIRPILDGISRALTEYAIQQMNMRLGLLYVDRHDMAEAFVTANTRSISYKR